jgi:GT2 family glycosyltransferase
VRTNGLSATLSWLGQEVFEPPTPTYRQWAQRYNSQDSAYRAWVKLYDRIDAREARAIRAYIAALPVKPKFSIIVPVFETPEEELLQMIASVSAQFYEDWELCIADDASRRGHVRAILEGAVIRDPRIKVCFRKENGNISATSNSGLELATGKFVALLDHDDVLAPHALAMMADAINNNPDADIFYSDEDKLDANGQRYGPYFKPDWNPELLYGQNLISHLGVYRTTLVRMLGGFRLGFEGSQDYDLALRAAAATKGPIVHVPHVLYHWRVYPGASTFSSTQLARALGAARRAIKEQLSSLGVKAQVTEAGSLFHRVLLEDPPIWPRVSAIIATRDHSEDLSTCVEGLLDKTDYPHLEVLIADNDSKEASTFFLFEKLCKRGVKILKCPGSFNFSRINNAAVRQCSGEIILLLNNDVEMREPGWLKEMVRQVLRPNIGVVGAKLIYPDGTLQHGGVALGLLGVAGHIHLGAPGDSSGYFGRLGLTQDISCVTAACMVIHRSVFDEVGGFDEYELPASFNDVDLCIRVRQLGYRILWTPHALLVHHESKSRGVEVNGKGSRGDLNEVEVMRERWGDVLDNDPFWNPNLSLRSHHPTITAPPRATRPWRES